MKQLLLCGTLLFCTTFLNAQTDSIDISTGRYANGAAISVLSPDDDWKVKTPGSSSYVAVKIGTGHSPASTGTGEQYGRRLSTSMVFCRNAPTIAWLCPYVYESNEVDYANDIFDGDMKESTAIVPDGDYKYQMSFNLDLDCKVVQSAQVVLYLLAAIDNLSDISINGHSLTLDTPIIHSVYALGQLQQQSSGCSNGTGYYWHRFPSAEYITINPLYLQDGSNSITITANKNNGPLAVGGSGFICDAKIKYTLIPDPVTVPRVSLTGSTRSVCVGDPADIYINLTNPQSAASYTVTLYETDGNSTWPVTGTTTPNPAAIDGASPASVIFQVYPGLMSQYIIKIKNNLTGCETEQLVHLAVCGMLPMFLIETEETPSGKYAIRTHSHYDFESALPGFDYHWLLEELDPSTMTPMYEIKHQSFWPSDRNSFEGFDADLSPEYKEQAVVEELPYPAGEGLFDAGSLYRITRYVSIDGLSVQSHSINIIPKDWGVESMRTGMASLKNNASLLSVYPNPAPGRFTIGTTGITGKIGVYDALGKLVKEVALQSNTTGYAVDISDLPKGMYMVNIISGNETACKKIIIE